MQFNDVEFCFGYLFVGWVLGMWAGLWICHYHNHRESK